MIRKNGSLIIYYKNEKNRDMEENIKTKRMRKVSSWMTDAVEAINNEDEILAGKRIVLKIIRYMENNHMSQKDLAEKLDVSPQYINKFLHGQDCDIKVSTAIRYGKILGLKLIEVPDVTTKKAGCSCRSLCG